MDCPYRYGDESCDIEEMCHDALELLKAQQADFNFSEWLMDELEKHNMSVFNLAKQTGLSYMTIRYYVQEKRTPTLGSLEVILDQFGKKLQIVDK